MTSEDLTTYIYPEDNAVQYYSSPKQFALSSCGRTDQCFVGPKYCSFIIVAFLIFFSFTFLEANQEQLQSVVACFLISICGYEAYCCSRQCDNNMRGRSKPSTASNKRNVKSTKCLSETGAHKEQCLRNPQKQNKEEINSFDLKIPDHDIFYDKLFFCLIVLSETFKMQKLCRWQGKLDEFMILLVLTRDILWMLVGNKIFAMSSFSFIPLFAYKIELLGGKTSF